jgi:hypothetical protein
LNNLTVEHTDPAMVDRFEAAYNRGETCNEFIPVPEDIGEGWYDFCVNNWGTKWDIGCENTRTHGLKPTRVGNQVTVTFDSAWAPPIGLYEELDRLGFMVDATYFEPGMAYCGIWHDGEDLYTEYTDKSMIPVRIWEDYNLEEFFEDEVEA